MEAIILAGGFGTRLKTVLSDLPKPMAPINNRPFLEHLLTYIINHGVNKIILSTGYMHETIEAYFGDRYKNASLSYSVEETPLGTGGGIKKAFQQVIGEHVLILNGDTFFNVDLNRFYESHISTSADLTLALKNMVNFDRYGIVSTAGTRVTGFVEKKHHKQGNINGGVYLAKRTLFNGIPLPEKFSFETDFMGDYVHQMNFNAYLSDGYFIDIGIPEDYLIAQRELVKYI